MSMALDYQSAAFLNHALAQGVPAKSLVSEPEVYRAKFGADLTDAQVASIKRYSRLGEESGASNFSPASRDFVRAVVADGRYLLDWQTEPRAVADRLGYPINPEVEDEIRRAKIEDIVAPNDPLAIRGLGLVSFAIAVVVAAADVAPPDATIIDLSNIQKL